MQKRRIYEGTYKEIEWRVLPSHRHLSWKTNRVGASGSNQVGSHQNEVVFAHVHLSPQPMMTNPGCPVETCPLEHLHALVLCKPPSGIKKSLRAFGYVHLGGSDSQYDDKGFCPATISEANLLRTNNIPGNREGKTYLPTVYFGVVFHCPQVPRAQRGVAHKT